MHPTIKDGWKVKITRVNPNDIRRGDIIIFYDSDLTCHRVLWKWKEGDKLFFLHKGDRSYIPKVTSAETVIGRTEEVRNLDSVKVDNKLWQRQGIFSSFYNRIIYLTFKPL